MEANHGDQARKKRTGKFLRKDRPVNLLSGRPLHISLDISSRGRSSF